MRGADEIDLVNSGLEESMAVAYSQTREIWKSDPKIPSLRTAAFIGAINKIATCYAELVSSRKRADAPFKPKKEYRYKLRKRNMQNLAHIQETELANNGLYEVIEGVSTRELDPEIVRLKEELDTERERGLRLLAEFDNYGDALGRNTPELNKMANANYSWHFLT